MIEQLNAAQICHVKSFMSREKWEYEYRTERKFLGITFRKKGYYWIVTIGDPILCTPAEIVKLNPHLYVKCQRVFYKPYLEFAMSNGIKYRKYFETSTALVDFMESDAMDGIKWIQKN